MKKLKKIGLILLALILLVFAGGLAFVSIYEEEIEQFAQEKIQESLVTDMSVSSLDFTIWDQFPQASIVFRDVLIEETFVEHDTLLYADKVFLQLDLFDVISGNYTVKDVTIETASLIIKRNPSGLDNYHFWKEAEGEGSEFSFALESVSLNDVATVIDDKKAEFALDVFADDVTLSGAFADKAFDLDAQAKVFIEEITVGVEKYVSRKNLLADFAMEINTGESAYYIREGAFELENIPFTATGSLMDQDEGILCDLKIDGEKVEIANVLEHLPESYKQSIAAYRAKGHINIDGKLEGMAGGGQHPNISATYTIDGARFIHHNSGVAMTDIRSKGAFEKENGEAEILTITAFQADFESGSFTSSGVIAEFAHPWIDLSFNGNMDLSDFHKFLELETVEELNGQFRLNASYQGKIADPSHITITDLNRAKVSGVMQFSDAIFQPKDAPHAFDKLKGKFTLANNDATIQNLTGVVQDSQFGLQGTLKNFLPFLLVEDERLSIQASFASSGLDFNTLLAEGGNKSSDEYHLVFPTDIDFDLDLSVDGLKFREFAATDIRGKALMNDRVFRLSPISLNTAEGQFSANVIADGRKASGFDVTCSAQLSDINVNELFREFENFGQEFIRDDHLKGIADAHVEFKSAFSNALQCNSDDIVSVVDIEVRDGELIDLRSMRNISQYVRTNAFVAPFVDEDALDDKLSHIYFATLHNEIDIRNGEITIPKMEIVSSAMDISATGTHSFENFIDYTIGFKIRDILSRQQESEFGSIEDDGLSNSFFLSMDGHVDNPQFGYDRMAHKEKRKEDREKEKQNVKALLKEELGLFKGDDTVGDYPAPKDNFSATVTISLDDDSEDEDKKDNKKPKKKRRGWLKGDDKEDDKVTISFDDDEDEDF